MTEGWNTLEFLERMNPNFTGFTIESIGHFEDKFYRCVLSPIMKPDGTRSGRTYQETQKDMMVGWDEEEDRLSIGIAFDSHLPRIAYGWLLNQANELHEMESPFISRVHVETPMPEEESGETIWIQCNWPIVLGISSSTTDLDVVLRDAIEALYEESEGFASYFRREWKKEAQS